MGRVIILAFGDLALTANSDRENRPIDPIITKMKRERGEDVLARRFERWKRKKKLF
jgi:hypothetical protein